MSDLLERGVAWLTGQRQACLSRPVEYRRRNGESYIAIPTSATVGRSEYDQVDEHGVLHRLEARDYLVTVSELPVVPKAGDRIAETVNGQVQVYEVMSPAGEPPWRYSDPDHRTYRIHTKHVATEEA